MIYIFLLTVICQNISNCASSWGVYTTSHDVECTGILHEYNCFGYLTFGLLITSSLKIHNFYFSYLSELHNLSFPFSLNSELCLFKTYMLTNRTILLSVLFNVEIRVR